MRFAKTIKQIQGIQAYHSGDKLNVEVRAKIPNIHVHKDKDNTSEKNNYLYLTDAQNRWTLSLTPAPR